MALKRDSFKPNFIFSPKYNKHKESTLIIIKELNELLQSKLTYKISTQVNKYMTAPQKPPPIPQKLRLVLLTLDLT